MKILFTCLLFSAACSVWPFHDPSAAAAESYRLSRTAPYAWYMDGVLYELKGDYKKAYEAFKSAWEFDQDAVPVLEELARVSIRLGKTEEAKDWINQALSIDPDNNELKMMLARIYATSSNPAEAVDILADILSSDPDNQEALFLQGSIYAQMQKFPEAVAALEKAAKQKGSRSFMAHYYLGKIYVEKGEYAKAREEFYNALAVNPRFVPLYIDLAMTYEAEHDTENALKVWRMLLEKQPDNLRVAAKVIELLLQEDRMDEALEVLDGIKGGGQALAALRFKVAITCLKDEKPEKALEILEPMRDVMPGNSQLLFYTALALEQAKRIDDAIETLKEIDLKDTVGPEAAIRVAYLLQSQGKDAEALSYIEECNRKLPDNPRLLLALSRMYNQVGRTEDSLALLEKFVNSGGSDKEIFMQLAMTYENQGRRAKAMKWAEKALELDPDYVPALNFVGYTWAEQGKNLDRAEEMLEKAVSLQPEDGFIIDSLGWLYYAQKRYDLAVEKLEKAHRLVPDDATIAEHLGDALMKKQRYYRALKIYRKALKLAKSRKEKRRLQKKIKQAADMISEMVDS